jgi:hypothetical protein
VGAGGWAGGCRLADGLDGFAEREGFAGLAVVVRWPGVVGVALGLGAVVDGWLVAGGPLTRPDGAAAGGWAGEGCGVVLPGIAYAYPAPSTAVPATVAATAQSVVFLTLIRPSSRRLVASSTDRSGLRRGPWDRLRRAMARKSFR